MSTEADEPGPSEVAAALQRRAVRNAAKLGALVRDRWGVDTAPDPFGTGAAVAADGVAYLLLEGTHGLGAGLAWTQRAGATIVHVVADEDPGTIARQAAEFRSDISVWRSEGRTLIEAVPAPHEPGIGPPDAPELVALLESEGLDVVVEGDRFAGEFRGLEVVRIVRALDDGEPILEVGVGRFDRELTAMMHGDMPADRSIARVVEQLRILRRPGGPVHPLGTLVPERWLRTILLADPAMVGCRSLSPVPTPVPRDRLRERGVAVAAGTRDDGSPVVVACTVGIDLDAVVVAADARLATDPDATLLLALPRRDVLPVTEALVADLVRPAEVATVPDDWRS